MDESNAIQDNKYYETGNAWSKLPYEELFNRIRWMYGQKKSSKLEDEELRSLIIFAKAAQLNPFTGECYIIPGQPPDIGTRGYEIKAVENLNAEAKALGIPKAKYYTKEISLNWQDYPGCKEGDIPVRVEITDTISFAAWRDSYNEQYAFFANLHKDKSHEELDQMTLEMIDEKPVWAGEAVIYANDNYARDGKNEKYSRKERAFKRAKKIALKKRFPKIGNLIESVKLQLSMQPTMAISETSSSMEEESDYIDGEYVQEEIEQQPQSTRPYSGQKLLNRIIEFADSSENKIYPDNKRWIIRQAIDDIFDRDVRKRHELCKFLTGKTSTKSDERNSISDKHMFALASWIGIREDNSYEITDTIKKEAYNALNYYEANNGQTTFL